MKFWGLVSAYSTVKKNIILRSVWGLLWLFVAASSVPAQTYTNPVIPGDFPDPSIIRVGEDFYATATTGGWAPGFPILHSKDLVNWKIINAVFKEKPKWAKGDFWAPEIIHDQGKFFVYYSARRDEGKNKKGTLCVAVAVADKPDGIWQDKGPLVCQEIGSIDADFVRDENGKPFLIWKEDGNDRQQPTWLYAQELDESGTKLKGASHKLFRNTETWEGIAIEGAYVLRRDGYFYLFYSGNACCGRSCNYALGVARAKTLFGPWEKNPANPILKGNESWQCPGHGSIVSTADEHSFLLYHAYRNSSVGFNIGREALLDEVKFADGWATINDGRGASATANAPFKNTRQQSAFSSLNDEFNGNSLGAQWTHPLFEDFAAQLNSGFLTLAPVNQQFSNGKNSEIVIAERTISGNYQATTRINFLKTSSDESAGISVYSWRQNAVGISYGNGKVFTWQRADGKQKELSNVVLSNAASTIFFKIKAQNAELFDFAYSLDGKNWLPVGATVSGSYIEGARLALIYDGQRTMPGIRFDWVKVEPNQSFTQQSY